MNTHKDPLLEFDAPDRAHYATGMLLDATDFQTEQTYHRDRLAQALAYLHGYGTVAGLEVKYQPGSKDLSKEAEIVVEPGIALDPLGRLVEVRKRACIRAKPWYENYCISPMSTGTPTSSPSGDVIADIFLRFRVQPRGKTPAFVAGPFDATDAVQPSRLLDGHELRMVAREGEAPPIPNWWWPTGEALPDPESLNDKQKKASLRAMIFSSWRESRESHLEKIRKNPFMPPSLCTPPGQENGDPDPAWIFLARLAIPPIKDWYSENAVLVNNEERPFSLSNAAMAWSLRL